MEVMEVTWLENSDLFVAESQAPYGAALRSHRDLRVYRQAFTLAQDIKLLAAAFPKEEQFLLRQQIIRSSRSVCSNIAEAWRKRRYEGSFVSKLSDAEGEAAETQTWIEFAEADGYVSEENARELWKRYEGLISSIVGIIDNAAKWTIKRSQK